MGLLLLPIFVAFVLVVSFVGWLVGRAVSRWRHSAYWGVGAFFLVWAVVLGPEVFVHAQLRYLCKTQGGVRVYETISAPKSLYFKEGGAVSGNDNNRWQEDAKVYLDYGYDSIENRSDKGDLYRYWRDKDGQMKRIKIAQPTSHYEKNHQKVIRINKYIWLNEDKIIDRNTNEIVAIYKNFEMAGGPLTDPILSHLDGTGSYCNYPQSLLYIYPSFTKTN